MTFLIFSTATVVLVSWGGVRLSQLDIQADNWSTVSAQGDRYQCGAVGGMITGSGNRRTPVPFRPPQIPHGLDEQGTVSAGVSEGGHTALVSSELESM
jgi:hypothetical protein